ncbi:MAG: ThiF family adenylyltransferase [Tannerella forsythia]|uniref:ThiF family adenylyltransferase n=1 Tax=Tannerella forsythia TaxID=28112 RepID=UPI00086AF8CF|nr:ThiF family adenylyltransferase [Tannerella forsythia]SCQ21278.1 thiamine biosynthesis protein ThiF [Tannerella forsythia]
MREYNHKIIKGSPIQGEHLKFARAKAIYKAAMRHPYAKDIQCYVNGKGNIIIRMCLTHLEIPDEPFYKIYDEEKVAIVCHPEDIDMPEVYALRKDFPTELPHSNAKPFARPVSLCISDVAFADIRPQFNAHDFLNYIRRWFSLNSINKLHEENRPLEVFFGFHEVCCILNERSDANPYVKYSKKTKFSSTLEFVEKGKATHYLVSIPTEKVYTSNFVRIPQTMGELKAVQSADQFSLADNLLSFLTNTVAGKATLPVVLLVFITQTSEDNKRTSHDLFLIKTKHSPKEIIQKKRALSHETFEQWFYELSIEVVLLISMNSRDGNAVNNGIKDWFKKVSVVGTGTLGSAVIDHFVRQGCSEEVNIVDCDMLFPHNLSRHTLTTNMVMTSKVRSIQEAYRGILNQKINTIEGNFLALNPNDKERLFKDTELVMDFSTSIAVERKLAKEGQAYRRCTSFLNPKGDEIVLLMEDQDRHSKLDLLEMDYYRNLIVDEKFVRHLEQTETVRTNSFSCRSESMVLNYENVRVLAAIISKQIRKYYAQKEACLNIWHFDAANGTVVNLPMTITNWRNEDLEGIHVYISDAVEKEIKAIADASPDKETGGCLFGSYDRDYNNIYVYYMVPASEDSIQTAVSFVRGIKGLTTEYERITKLTYNQVRYLGEWHSHPNMPNTPSDTDKKQFEELWEEQQSQDLPFVQMIHGNNGIFVKAKDSIL